MKQYQMTIALLAALTLLVTGWMVFAPPVHAAADCFTDTNDHWAEKFICWLKEKGIAGGYPDGSYHPNQGITRAEMAVMLQQQAEVPPTTGALLVNVPGAAWQLERQYDDFINVSDLKLTPAGLEISAGILNEIFVIAPSLPSVLYSQSFDLVGLEFCHDGEANLYVDAVELTVFRNSTGTGSVIASATDDTNRTVAECRMYSLNTPVALTADDTLTFKASVKSEFAPTKFTLGRVTVVLQATGTQAVLPLQAAPNVTELNVQFPQAE